MLKPWIEKNKILIVGGSGGVGKTSISATLGIASAKAGYKTMVLTIDPARRLAGALGLDQIGNEAVSINAALEQAGVSVSGEMFAMMLNVQNTFDQLVEQYSPDPDLKQRIINNRMYKTIVTKLSGSQEYASMQRLEQIAEEDVYDKIILDTPPTTHALDFLNAPQRVTDFFDSKVIQLFTGVTKTGWNFLKPGSSLFFKALDKLSGAGVVGEIAQFFQLVEPLLEPVRQQPEKAGELLKEDSTSFIIVSGPQGDHLEDALLFRKKLEELDIHVAGWIVNRVLPPIYEDGGEGKPATETNPNFDDELVKRIVEWCSRLENLAHSQQAMIQAFSQASALELKWIPVLKQDVHSIESLLLMLGELGL